MRGREALLWTTVMLAVTQEGHTALPSPCGLAEGPGFPVAQAREAHWRATQPWTSRAASRGSQAPPHWRLGPDEGCERQVVPLHLLLPEEAASVFPGGPRLEESPVLPASGTPGTGQRPGWHFVHRTSRKPQHKLAREVVATHFTDKTAAGGAIKYPRRHHQSGWRHTGAQGCPPPHGRPAPGRPCAAVFRGVTGGTWGCC